MKTRFAFLGVGDLHLSATAPESRKDKDTYIETQNRKIQEIISIAEENSVDAILQTGDFFDKALPPFEAASAFINSWFRTKEIYENTDKGKPYVPKTISIPGNHDLWHKSVATIKRSMFGFINLMTMLHFVTKDNPVIFEKDGLKVAITGCPYSALSDTANKNDYIINEKLGDVHIHLMHGYLYPKHRGKIFDHTVIDEIIDTKADITICGHDHPGWGVVKQDNKYFINSGSIMRIDADKNEIKRQPEVVLIEIVDGVISVTEIPLKSALPGEQVLSRDHIEQAKKKKEQLNEITEEILSIGEFKGTSAFEIIEEIAAIENIDEEIKKRVVARIEKISEILK